MAKSQNKTVETSSSVDQFISLIENDEKRTDSIRIIRMLEDISKEPPVMWGTSIIGFGRYHYKYESGREGDFLKIGFSPRKQNLTLYIMPGFDRYDELMQQLGKYTTGKSCLYIKRLEDIQWDVLVQLSTLSYQHMTKKYG